MHQCRGEKVDDGEEGEKMVRSGIRRRLGVNEEGKEGEGKVCDQQQQDKQLLNEKSKDEEEKKEINQYRYELCNLFFSDLVESHFLSSKTNA